MLELIFRNNFLYIEELILMKSIQEHLRQLPQTDPTSNMLQVALCLDVLFEHFKQSWINQVQDVSQKITLHRPNPGAKAMDGLFKYIGNRAWFARALSLWGHLKTVHFIARA